MIHSTLIAHAKFNLGRAPNITWSWPRSQVSYIRKPWRADRHWVGNYHETQYAILWKCNSVHQEEGKSPNINCQQCAACQGISYKHNVTFSPKFFPQIVRNVSDISQHKLKKTRKWWHYDIKVSFTSREYIIDNSVAMVPVKLANGNSKDGDHRYGSRQ